MTHYYPAYLDLTGRRCVVIGAGEIAERKVAQLIASEADVMLVSPTATPEIESLAAKGQVRWLKREYAPGDLAGATLAIAAATFSIASARDRNGFNGLLCGLI